VDIAGNISKRFSASGIRFARFSGACPKWNVHAAFLQPGFIRTQLSRMPDGTTFFCIARTVRKEGGGFQVSQTRFAIGLGCEIDHARAEHDRTIEADHCGALIPYAIGPIPDAVLAGLAKRRPDLADPSVLVPAGWDALIETIDRFVAVGTSKFVVLPIVEPASPAEWVRHLEDAAPVVSARQT
jgi:hypothetical protein